MSEAGAGLLGQGVRFLAFGALNTLLGYALFCLLALALHPQLAYALAFAAGILLAFVGNSVLVFRVGLQWTRLRPVAAVYLGQYLGNALLLQFALSVLRWPPWLGLAAALCITVPLTFLLNRRVLRA